MKLDCDRTFVSAKNFVWNNPWDLLYFRTNRREIDTEVIPMSNAYIMTGTLTNAHTVTLDEPMPLKPMKVKASITQMVLEDRRGE